MKGWRTIAVNALTFLAALAAWPQITEYVPAQAVALALAAANLVLRWITTTPVGQGKEA